MIQEIITYGIITLTVFIIGYSIYRRVSGKATTPNKCSGCSGCGASKSKNDVKNKECSSENQQLK